MMPWCAFFWCEYYVNQYNKDEVYVFSQHPGNWWYSCLTWCCIFRRGFCCLLCIIIDFSRMHILAFVCIYILTSQIEGNFEKELLSFFSCLWALPNFITKRCFYYWCLITKWHYNRPQLLAHPKVRCQTQKRIIWTTWTRTIKDILKVVKCLSMWPKQQQPVFTVSYLHGMLSMPWDSWQRGGLGSSQESGQLEAGQ